MSLDVIKNFCKVTASAGYNDTATEIVLLAGEGATLPTVPFNLVWWDSTQYTDPAECPTVEIVRVTNVAIDTLTIVRAQESTAATVKNVSGHTYKLVNAFTKFTYDLIKTTVDATTGTNTGDNTIATAEVVTDTASATTWPALYEAATGSIAVHTDAGLTYNASTANLATTTFTGALTGHASLDAPINSPTFTGTLTVPVGLTGLLRADTGVVSIDTDVTNLVDNLSYTQLADGTDGNLITWDAAGAPALVATGTATHVLTSNGVGTAPTFQAAAGGAQTVSIYLPAEASYLPATAPAELAEIAGSGVYGGWSYLAFDDTTSEHAVWRVPVPGYDGGNITVTAFSKPATTPAGAVTLQYDILTIGLANSEAFNAAITVDTTVNISHSLNTTELNTDICIASATIDPANVAADDLLVIELARDVATDTLVGDGQLLGILVSYTRT